VIGTQTYRGVWWLPSDPQDRRNGTLTITAGEVSLDLVGHFGREIISESDHEISYSLFLADQERILGATTDGNHITLVDCSQAAGGRLLLGLSTDLETAVYRARAAIVGNGRFDEGEAVEFDHVELRLAALESWLQIRHATLNLSASGDGGTIEFTRVPPMEFQLDGGPTATIRFSSSVQSVGPEATRAGYEWSSWLGLKFPEMCSLDDVKSAVGWLRNLLVLATGKPLTVLAVHGYRDDWTGPDGYPVQMGLFYSLFYNPDPMPRPVNWWELLFDYPQIAERLADVLSRWIALHQQYDAVIGLFFGTIYQQASYREQRFLQYAQAIETYDRLKRPGATIRGRDAFRALRDEIVAAVPQEHRAWLKTELAWSNDLKLADRITHVLSSCPEVAERIVGSEGIDAFVKAVKWTRNYYTHYDPKGKAKAATDGQDMHRLTVQLRAVLETVLLVELGFDSDEIAAGLERARRFEEIDLMRR
jgi:hypothetical protein